MSGSQGSAVPEAGTAVAPDVPAILIEAAEAAAIEWLLVVPASGLGPVYAHFGDRGRCVFATREEEAVAIAAGLALAGSRPLVLMQQSGVGNALNAVLSLADAYEVRFPIVVCDRGDADPNPVQRVSSRGTAAVLRALGAGWVDWETRDPAGALREMLKRRRWIVCPLPGAG
jgi:sulfopyruvate decarboxylase subunit alpha